ncbi:MAG: D-tyrosyl-tRNA(Tyr) deacylase, partial [Armatimonadetes bacterium]|nr:D-tyrosyl-tRNA(Tyr) deacylase [Armatimonadota bacterium]
MRAVVQRVCSASVSVEEKTVSEIGRGLLVLVSFGPDDQRADLDYMASKVVDLRIFEDDEGKMNLSVRDVGGSILLVPNFTLHADCRRGRRPSFSDAAAPEQAAALFEVFTGLVAETGVPVATGVFGA